MKAQCLPFSQVPHTTELFADFLSGSPKVRQFFPRSPHFSEWLKEEAALMGYDSGRRARVADILEKQNRNWNGSARTLENIARLRVGAAAVVTGQQVGLFGGPAFSLFKALTAVKLADEASRSGVDCVPVFWLATQDHDVEEVSHLTLPSSDAGLRQLQVPAQGLTGAPVGTLKFGAEVEAAVQAAAEALGDSEVLGFLRDAYRPGENFGDAFARLFARLFADWGVILLDADDAELNAIAAPVYRAAAEKAQALDESLLNRGRELESAGYHQQVNVTPSSTLLFVLHDGVRTPIYRRVNGTSEVEFLIGEERVPQPELLRRIAATPHHFSANVLLRPVVQDYLLPTLAYTGGSAEVAYFAQAAVVYQSILGRITPVLPRFSATLIETKLQGLLERYGLTLPDIFPGPEKVRERLAARALPQELQSAFDNTSATLKRSFASIRDALTRLDKTLIDAAVNAESKIEHQLETLRTRAARAELRQSEVLDRHAQLLSNALYPNKVLQEREIGGIYFVARYGQGLLKDLYETIHTDCYDHQLISL